MTRFRTPITALALLGATLVVTGAPTAAVASESAATTTGTPLRSYADRADVRIGTAVDMTALAQDKQYRRTTAREFSSVTAENVMKWESVEPQRGVYDWSKADALVDFAKENGQAVRGHTLIWHNQLPKWLTSGVADGSIGSDELRAILKNHITTEVEHFKGKIYQWDVVNEVFNDDGTLRNSIWLQQLGPDYIADAFRWAHEADPKAKLFVNDYNVEGVNAKSTAYYNLVKELLAEGVPVQGFGIQGHLGVQYGFPGDVAANLQRFADLGLETAFTEVDIRMVMPADDTKLAKQADYYRGLLDACLGATSCKSFTVWGYTDKYSWVPGTFSGQGAANLLDENYVEKPAFYAVREELASGR
ncbi:endo-1,4-beta-xylanase [Streptomyces sp. NPDC002577]